MSGINLQSVPVGESRDEFKEAYYADLVKEKENIESKAVNRKAKWAYDICSSIDNLNTNDIIKNIGTLPKLKIIKNG